MSVYHRGLQVIAPQEQRRSAYQVGALVATPGTIRDEVNDLNAEIRQMDNELGAIRSAWGTIRDADLPEPAHSMDLWWHNNWLPFFTEWDKFWKDHGNKVGLANWYHNFWGAAWEKVQEYRARLITIRNSARAIGYDFTGPDPTPPKEGPFKSAASELWRMVKVLVYAGLAIAAGILLWRFIQSSRG